MTTLMATDLAWKSRVVADEVDANNVLNHWVMKTQLLETAGNLKLLQLVANALRTRKVKHLIRNRRGGWALHVGAHVRTFVEAKVTQPSCMPVCPFML